MEVIPPGPPPTGPPTDATRPRPRRQALLVIGSVAALVAAATFIYESTPTRSMIRALRGGDEAARRVAATGLNDLSAIDLDAAVPALGAAMVHDPSAEVRAEATRTIGTLGAEAITRRDNTARDQAVGALLAASDDKDAAVRVVAISMIPVLANAATMQSNNENDLAPIGAPRAIVSKLITALDGPDEAVRKAAVRALGSFPIQLDAHLPLLFAKAIAEPVAARPGANGVMVGLLRRVRPLKPSIPFLMQQLGTSDPRTRSLAIATLGQAEADSIDAVPELIKLLADPADADGRDDPARAAATALGRIAPGTSRSAEAVVALQAGQGSAPQGRERAIAAALRNFDQPTP